MRIKTIHIFLLLLVVIQSSCFLAERQISTDFKGFEVISGQEKTDLLVEIYRGKPNKFSLASSVKVENAISTRSFEQVLLADGDQYRSTWYAPNYIQTLAFLIDDSKDKLYCDITTLKCWQGLPEDGEMEGLGAVIGIEGLSLSRLMKGLPPEKDFYEETSIRKNKKTNQEFLVDFSNKRLSLVAKFVRIESGKLNLTEMFVSENGKRIAEIDWSYSTQLDKIPASTEVNFVTKGFSITLKTRKYSDQSEVKPNVFELLVPNGFELNQ